MSGKSRRGLKVKFGKRLSFPMALKVYELLESYSEKLQLPPTRLIAIALEREMIRSKPFEDFVITIPESGHYSEFEFSDEAGKIVNWFRTNRNVGVTLDQLYIFRYDMEILDGHIFLAGVRECLDRGMLETYIPKRGKLNEVHFKKNENYMRLRLTKEALK
jgi:hypothetical protein